MSNQCVDNRKQQWYKQAPEKSSEMLFIFYQYASYKDESDNVPRFGKREFD